MNYREIANIDLKGSYEPSLKVLGLIHTERNASEWFKKKQAQHEAQEYPDTATESL